VDDLAVRVCAGDAEESIISWLFCSLSYYCVSRLNV
jgi:hypothetical protein